MSGVQLTLARTWLLLVALTLASVAVAEAVDGRAVMLLAVFGVAIAKAQIVAARFMETAHARPVWRTLYHSWIVVIGLILLGGHLLAPGG